jgi:hypothetical protein
LLEEALQFWNCTLHILVDFRQHRHYSQPGEWIGNAVKIAFQASASLLVTFESEVNGDYRFAHGFR